MGVNFVTIFQISPTSTFHHFSIFRIVGEAEPQADPFRTPHLRLHTNGAPCAVA